MFYIYIKKEEQQRSNFKSYNFLFFLFLIYGNDKRLLKLTIVKMCGVIVAYG